VAYNGRNINRYQQILDANFTFFLSTGDVNNGLPAQWGQAEEIDYNRKMFDKSYTGPNACKSIVMDVRIEDGIQWQSIVQESGETWYTCTVNYDFRIDVVPDKTFINNPGAKAQYTVRNAGTDAKPHWQLVEMRDLGDPSS